MNQNPFSQKVKTYTFSAIFLTAIAVLWRSCNFLFFFDTSVDYFQKTPSHTGLQALGVLTIVWLLSAMILIPQYAFSPKARPNTGRASRLTGLICAATVAASFFFFRECITFYIANARLYNLLAIFSLLSALYFAFRFLGDTPPAYRALAGYLVIIWLALLLCATYLNLYVAMNSPFKLTLHLALLSIMLHLLEEIRLDTGHAFRIAHFSFTWIAVFHCAMASIPVLIAFAAKRYQQPDYLLYASLSLILLVYLASRAYDCYRLLMTAPPATEEEIAAEKAKKKEKSNTNKSKHSDDTQKEGDDSHVS